MSSFDSNTPMQQSEQVYMSTSKFDSCDDLLKSVREFYRFKGYGISIRGSRKDRHVILQCDRGGSYRDIRCISSKRKKTTTSRLINCPFKIVGKKCSDGAWIFDVKDLSHNHEPSTDVSGHPSFRQLPSECVKVVKEMTKAGIPPRQILSSLRQQSPNLLAISRTIYNVKRKIRREELGDRPMIIALFDTLSLDPPSDLHDESNGRLDDLLDELRLSYQRWPLYKKEHALLVITKLVNFSDTVFEPVIQRPKGRPPKSKKKKGITSTTRDPSRFELVESSQRRNEADGENNLFDLNVYPLDTFDLDGPF